MWFRSSSWRQVVLWRGGFPIALGALIVLVGIGFGTPGPLAAQKITVDFSDDDRTEERRIEEEMVIAEEAIENLLSDLEESYRVVRLRDGFLLEPRDGVDSGSIEVSADGYAIDGQEVSVEEIEARLGRDRAAPIIALGAAAVAPPAVSDPRPRRPPRAPRPPRPARPRGDAQIVVGENVRVEAGEVSRDVVVMGGSLTVDGRVLGDAVAIGGSVEVSGEVTGDVASIGNSVVLDSTAEVLGDVVSVGGSVEQAEGAEITGRVVEVPFSPRFAISGIGDWKKWKDKPWRDIESHNHDHDFSPAMGVFGFGWEVFSLVLLALLACLVLLVAREPVARVGRRAWQEPWKSGLVGLLSQVLFLPLLCGLIVILLISIVGIPFILLLPFVLIGLVLVGFLGYTAVALRAGKWVEGRFGWKLSSPFLALLAGIAVIHVWSLIGEVLSFGPGPIKFFAVMFAVFGALVCYAAWTVGFGAALLTKFGMASGWGDDGDLPSGSALGSAVPDAPGGAPADSVDPVGPADGGGASGWEYEELPPVPAEDSAPDESWTESNPDDDVKS